MAKAINLEIKHPGLGHSPGTAMQLLVTYLSVVFLIYKTSLCHILQQTRQLKWSITIWYYKTQVSLPATSKKQLVQFFILKIDFGGTKREKWGGETYMDWLPPACVPTSDGTRNLVWALPGAWNPGLSHQLSRTGRGASILLTSPPQIYMLNVHLQRLWSCCASKMSTCTNFENGKGNYQKKISPKTLQSL